MSKTGDALEALFTALTAKAAEGSPKIPMPVQNEDLASRLKDMGDKIAMSLNVWDDSDDEPEEMLGADITPDGYEITKEVPVEFIVAGGAREARRVAFEAGLEAIDDAVRGVIGDVEVEDRTLGGKVDDARMLAPRRNGSGLVVDGMPNVLAATIRIRLTFTSSRIF